MLNKSIHLVLTKTVCRKQTVESVYDLGEFEILKNRLLGKHFLLRQVMEV